MRSGFISIWTVGFDGHIDMDDVESMSTRQFVSICGRKDIVRRGRDVLDDLRGVSERSKRFETGHSPRMSPLLAFDSIVEFGTESILHLDFRACPNTLEA